jgi:hypothetical protein
MRAQRLGGTPPEARSEARLSIGTGGLGGICWTDVLHRLERERVALRARQGQRGPHVRSGREIPDGRAGLTRHTD